MDEAKTRYGNTQWEVGKVFPFYLSREYTCLIPGLDHMTGYIIPIHAEQPGMEIPYQPPTRYFHTRF